MSQPQSLAQHITAARMRRRYSARQLAAQVGVAPSTITRIEDGSLAVPNPGLLLALVDALGLDLAVTVELVEPYRRLWHHLRASHNRTDTAPTIRTG